MPEESFYCALDCWKVSFISLVAFRKGSIKLIKETNARDHLFNEDQEHDEQQLIR